jgi:hypothetical protein
MGPDLVSVPVYYVGTTSRGPRLYREFHKVRADLDAAVAAVNEALHVSSIDKDYSSAWWAQGGPVVDSVTHANGVISVALSADQDLSTRPPGMSAALATMSLQQIVYTVQAALQSTDPVQLTVNAAAGGTTDQIFGIPTAQPLTRGSAVDTLAQVWIIDPGEHTRVPRRFTVHGVAAAFEATVVWKLLRGGTVVRHGAAMTQQSGTMSPFTFTVHAPPGAYTLMVRDTDPSGGEGFAPWRDTKRVRVVG